MGRLVFEKRRNNRVASLIIQSSHNLARLVGFKTTLEEVERFFMAIVHETVQYRETNNVSRNDFMDLLIKLKNSKNQSETLGGISMNELAAQVYLSVEGNALLKH